MRIVMRNHKTFSPKRPTEIEFFSANFGKLLTIGESISSAQVSITVKSGTDHDTEAMKAQACSFDAANHVVSQLISGGMDGSTYEITFQVHTSIGQVLELCAELPVLSCS